MAAPISPVSITPPAELIAPQSPSSNSRSQSQKGAFRSELNNASQNARAEKQSSKRTENNQSDNKSIKSSSSKEQVAKSEDATRSQSSRNAADTNALKASKQAQVDKSVNSPANDSAKNASISHGRADKTKMSTAQEGKQLPQNGDQLPLDKELSAEQIAAFAADHPDLDKQALDNEIARLQAEIGSAAAAQTLSQIVQPIENTNVQVNTPTVVTTNQEQTLANNNAVNTSPAPIAANLVQAFSPQVGAVAEVSNVRESAVKAQTVDPLGLQKASLANSQSVNGQPNNNQQITNNSTQNLAAVSVVGNVVENVVAAKQNTPVSNAAAATAQVDVQAAKGKSDNGSLLTQLDSLASSQAGKQSNNVTPVLSADPIGNKIGTSNAGNIQSIDAAPKVNIEQTVAVPASQVNSAAVVVDDATTKVQPVIGTNGALDAELSAKRADLNSVQTSQNVTSKVIDDVQGNVVNDKEQLASVKVASVVQNGVAQTSVVENQAVAASAVVQNEVVKNEIVKNEQQEKPSRNENLNAPNNNVSDAKREQAFAPQASSQAAVNPTVQNPSANFSQSNAEQSLNLNQALNKMRAGVDSDSAKVANDDVADVKASSARAITGAENLQQLSSLQNNLRSASPVQMQMPAGTPPGSKNWGKAVADKVFIAASQNLRVANIHLDPPELGALQIRLQVTGPDQQMSVTFSSPHAAVRDVLEQQIPRLKEMLAEQGINLGESSVNDQGGDKKDGARGSDQKGSAGYGDNSDVDSPSNPLNTQGTLSLVDFYA